MRSLYIYWIAVALSLPVSFAENSESIIEFGQSHTCRQDGSEFNCWGLNTETQAQPPLNLRRIKGLAMGELHSCAIDAEDEIQCWGYDQFGQTTEIPKVFGTPIRLYADGDSHSTCVVTDIGEVKCWGRLSTFEALPSQILKVRDIAIGGRNVCALKETGEVICRHARKEKDMETPVDLGPQSLVALNDYGVCVSDRLAVRCWGQDFYSMNDIPEGLTNIRQLESSSAGMCALTDSEFVCWGSYLNLHLDEVSKFPVEEIVRVELNDYRGCVYLKSGLPRCFGDNEANQNRFARKLGRVQSFYVDELRTCVNDGKGMICHGVRLEPKDEKLANQFRDFEKAAFDVYSDGSCLIQEGRLHCSREDQRSKFPTEGYYRDLQSNRRTVCALVDQSLHCVGFKKDYDEYLNSRFKQIKKFVLDGRKLCVLQMDNSVHCFRETNGKKLQVMDFYKFETADFTIGFDRVCALSPKGNMVCKSLSGDPFLRLDGVQEIWEFDAKICVSQSGKIRCFNDAGEKELDTRGELVNPRSVKSSFYHSCAMTDEGLACWGENDVSQLYDERPKVLTRAR